MLHTVTSVEPGNNQGNLPEWGEGGRECVEIVTERFLFSYIINIFKVKEE